MGGVLLDGLRWVLEGGYGGHADVFADAVIPRCGRVLDFGCGTGTFAPYFAPQTYMGIDIDEACIRRARKRRPGYSFQSMAGPCLGLPDGRFDVCFAAGVFHHMDDETALKALSEIARVIKPDGTFVVWEDVPTRSSLNLVGAAVHRLDQGRFIRRAAQYGELFKTRFTVEKQYHMRSGFMDYEVYVLKKI